MEGKFTNKNESLGEVDNSTLNISQSDANNLNESFNQNQLAGLGPKMKELVRKSQTRVEAFQDFYKSVKSYKNFDSDVHMDEYIEKKENELVYKQ